MLAGMSTPRLWRSDMGCNSCEVAHSCGCTLARNITSCVLLYPGRLLLTCPVIKLQECHRIRCQKGLPYVLGRAPPTL